MKFHRSIIRRAPHRDATAQMRNLSTLVWLLTLVFVGGCATPADKPQEPSDTIVGKPPPADEDPFFIQGALSEANRVDTRGRIEPEEPAAAAQPANEDVQPDDENIQPEASAPKKTAPADPEENEVASASKEAVSEAAEKPQHEQDSTVETQPEPKTRVAPRGELASVTKSAPPKTRARLPEPTVPPETPTQPHCFSCVKICPVEGGCDQADEDIICGWGTQERADEAKTLARAQCDATLDLARQMPVWSRIDGECPPAACR